MDVAGRPALRGPRLLVAAVLGGLLAATCSITHSLALERRVALVIGNSKYSNASLVLSNPKNDADDVTAALRDLGFEVIQAIDASKRDVEMSLARFGRLAAGADAALFFYAGHALQHQGRNYLMPVDGELEDEFSLRYQMASVDDVQAALDGAAGVKIMILDACRNNPAADIFKRKLAGGGARALTATRGLARVDRAQGIVVAYATSADAVAMDGQGRNSPYTQALLKRLREPGLEIEMMFRRIAADVNTQTGGRQRPETYVSLINEYYLNQKDRIHWDKIKSTQDPAVFQDFIVRYPSSIMAADAQARLRALEGATRDSERAKEQAEREARARQQEAERMRLAGLERDQQEREAAQRRQDEEMRARAEAAKTLREQEERARQAAVERERQEREAAQRRQQEESAARAAAAKKLREQQEQQKRQAALERERQEGEAAERRHQEEALAKAEAAKKLLEQEQQARVAALDRERQRETVQRRDDEQRRQSVTAVNPATTPGDSCQRDGERLARLRASPEREEVMRFERELTCERLRLQVVRLRESVGGAEPSASVVRSQPASGAVAAASANVEAETKMRDREAGIRVQPVAGPAPVVASPEACKRDEEKLVRLRASRLRDEISRFERELGCEKLRPQVLRLRESLE